MTDLITEVADYYSAKLAEHGQTARGVDWNDEGSQVLRFDQLMRIIPGQEAFSLNDIGCGYGALLDYLQTRYSHFAYQGFDVSAAMVKAGQARYAQMPNTRFIQASVPDQVADFGVASGIFNVKLYRTDEEWRGYMEDVIAHLDRTSLRGFAFNCLTSYSDQDKMRHDLYYANPTWWFDLCKRHYSRHVALLHDYGLYEFTILVRKTL
jgi:SAM-dependent methyltransferase